ncbi:MAG TPA: hypothetical protein VGQ64_12155 [Candidatus Limnocylindrales bacterium]|nr:hypothetical protein [Candidatus Limnocylindrales bacterium]
MTPCSLAALRKLTSFNVTTVASRQIARPGSMKMPLPGLSLGPTGDGAIDVHEVTRIRRLAASLAVPLLLGACGPT